MKSIGNYAFQNTSITTITLPESLKSIGNSAFFGCSSLKEVEFIGTGSIAIDSSAFLDCPLLETQIISNGLLINASPVEDGKYTVPDGVHEISENAYRYRTDMVEITLTPSVMKIGAEAFSKCSSLEVVNGLTESVDIGRRAFAGTPLKEAIILNNKLIYVPDTSSYEEYNVPATVRSIADYAFSGNNHVKKVTFAGTMLGESPLELGMGIFYNCENLAEVELPKGLTFIYSSMFSGCTSLKTFEIPDTVTYIYASAFSSSGIEEITIPSSVLTIEDSVFRNCKSLKKVIFENPNIQLVAQNINGPIDATNIFMDCSNLTDVTLPEKLGKIPSQTFSGCTSLKSIRIPATVTSIGQMAFSNSGLEELTLLEGLTYIEGNAFSDCKDLKTVVIPSTCYPMIKSGWSYTGGVGPYAFRSAGSSTQEGVVVTIHGNTFINYNAFDGAKIKELYMDGSPEIDKNAFMNATIGKIVIAGGLGFDCVSVNVIKDKIVDGTLPVYIKNGDEYVASSMLITNTATDGTLIIGEGIVAISPSLMKGKGLTAITIDPKNNYFTVKDRALYYESNNADADALENATLIAVLKGTGETAITDFIIPEGVVTVASYAFSGNNLKIDTVTVAKSVKYLSRYSLENVSAILITSENSVPDYDAYVTGGLSKLYFLPTVDSEISKNIAIKYRNNSKTSSFTFGGYYLSDGGNTIVVSIINGSINSIAMDGADSEKKVKISLKDSHSQSLDTIVLKEGWIIRTAKVVDRNDDGTYTFKFDQMGTKMVWTSGVEINKYKVSTNLDPSFKVSFSTINKDSVAHGTDVRFMVIPSDGYEGNSINVKIGGETATLTDGLYVMTVVSDIHIEISGIKPKNTFTVTFDSDGGSDVSSQSIVTGYAATFPTNPTKEGKIFFGWYADEKLYDFTSAVTRDVALKAKWIDVDAAKVKLTINADNGTIVGRSLNDNSIVTDTVYEGSTLIFVFTPKNMGYEVLSWKVGSSTYSTNSVVREVVINEDTEISVSSSYTISSYPYLETDIKTPVKGDTYKMAWKVNGTTGFNKMVYTPSILGDYVYSWSGDEIYKISLYDGTIVKKVSTGAATGYLYYNLVTVGNGYVLAGYAGQVYDADLNPVFQLYYDDETRASELKTYYNDGYFYIFTKDKVYKFEANDTNINENNIQKPTVSGDTKYEHYISFYQGQSNLIFTDRFIIGLEINGNQSQNRYAVTYDIDTLECIDSYEFDGLVKGNLNTGYISYYGGVFYFNTYSPSSNMFSTSNEDWTSLGTIEIDEDGKFIPVTVHYYDLGTSSYVSSFIVVGDYGYVNAGNTFKVYDIKTMKPVKTMNSTMSHGNMAVSIQGDIVTAYIVPYGSQYTLYAFQHDQTNNVLTNVSLNDVLDTKEYCSQIVHFGPNGEILYYNDSGYLFCIQPAYTATLVDSDGTIVKDITFYANEDNDLPSIAKTWYKFDGWYAEKDYTGTKATSIPIGEVGDRTYYARFNPLTSSDLVSGVEVSAFANDGKKVLFRIESGKNVSAVSVVVGYSAYVTVAEGTFLCPTFTETFETTIINGLVEFSTRDDVRMESVSVFCCYEVDTITYTTTLTDEFVPVMSSVVELSADSGVTLTLNGSKVADGQTLTFGSYAVGVNGEDGSSYSVNGVTVTDGTRLFFTGQKLTVSKN